MTGRGVRPVLAGYAALPAHACAEAADELVSAWRESFAE